MKKFILIFALLISAQSFSQLPYTNFTKPNTLNMKTVTYTVPVGGSVTYLSNNNNGDTYIIWVSQTAVFCPPDQMPLGWSVSEAFYPIGGEFTYEVGLDWNLLMDEKINIWQQIH
jgi:hypothetical protein